MSILLILVPIYFGSKNIKYYTANYADNSCYQNKCPSYSRGIITYGISAGVQPPPIKYKPNY
jgi:hypothetical protein